MREPDVVVRWAGKQGRAAGSSVVGRGVGRGGILAVAGGQERNIALISRVWHCR